MGELERVMVNLALEMGVLVTLEILVSLREGESLYSLCVSLP